MERRTPNLIVTVILTSVLTGLVSSLSTVAALSVKVEWAHEDARRAHLRIDKLDSRVEMLEQRRQKPAQ